MSDWLVSHEEVVEAVAGNEDRRVARDEQWRCTTEEKRRLLAAEIKIPFGLRKDQVEPVEDILTDVPELQKSLQEILGKQLAAGTISNYQSAVTRFQDFCDRAEYDYTQISERVIIHYLADLNDKKVSYGIICQVRPALVLLEEMHKGRSDCFTPRAERILEGAKRAAAERRPTVKKATQVTLDCLKGMVSRCITAKQEENRVDPYEFRTVYKAVVVYFTLCRFADYQQLQARHVEPVGEDVHITFPKAKNDQMHNGQVTVMKKNGTELCPVAMTHRYFRLLGLRMGEQNGDRRHLFCRIRKAGGSWAACSGQPASASKARENLKQLLDKSGIPSKGVSDKSFKMLGVTGMMEAGMTAEEVSIHGRWRSKDMPMRYKHNSAEYKTSMAAKVPF